MKEELNSKIINILEVDDESTYTVLDFGCGKGALLNALRNKLNKNSKLIGTNALEKDQEKALQNFGDKDIEFVFSKFTNRLDFPDKYFDIIVSVDALECIPDKISFVNEIHRVLKPNGQLLIAHWDWDTQVYFTKHKTLMRKIIHEYADWQQDWMDSADGMMGRKLWSIFEGSQLFRGKVEVYNQIETEFVEGKYGYETMMGFSGLVKNGKITEQELVTVVEEMKLLNEKNQYFYSLNSYLYIGRKK